MIGLGISIPKIAVNSEGGSLASLISSLFRNNEQGVWYDPSDMSTMFQDAAGAAPVTGMEQPVGLILDKSRGLVIGPELVVNGDFSNGTTGWAAVRSTLSATSGALVVTGTTAYPGAWQAFTTTAGRLYKVTFQIVSMGTANTVRFAPKNGTGDAGSALVIIDYTTPGMKTAYFFASGSTSTVYILAEQNAVVNFSIDNISVRELPGNHATQTTSALRPILSARVNLLTKTEQFDDPVWVTSGRATIDANNTTAPNGTLTADRITETVDNGTHRVSQLAIPSAGNFTFFVNWKKGTRKWVWVSVNNATNSVIQFFDLDNATLGASNTRGAGIVRISAAITPVPNGFFRCALTVSTAYTSHDVYTGLAETNGINEYSGSTSEYGYIWGASLVPANQASLPYQRVNTSTDYDTAGFPHYLRFNGADTFLVTPNINFTSTDKMTVFAGVRKLSDADSIIAETSINSGLSNGSIMLRSAVSGNAGYYWRSYGSLFPSSEASVTTGYSAPISNVLTGLGNISGDSSILRINGSQVSIATADQGTGNYGNYPLYIGRRGGTSLPFNGHLYSLIVRGAQSTAQQIANAEKYVAIKTGFSKPSIIGLPTIGL